MFVWHHEAITQLKVLRESIEPVVLGSRDEVGFVAIGLWATCRRSRQQLDRGREQWHNRTDEDG